MFYMHIINESYVDYISYIFLLDFSCKGRSSDIFLGLFNFYFDKDKLIDKKDDNNGDKGIDDCGGKKLFWGDGGL